MASVQHPAPIVEVPGASRGAIYFAPRKFTRMDKTGQDRACYQHACLKYVNRDRLANTSLRERFGIAFDNKATASQLIKEAVEVGVIVPYDPETSKRYMKYVPWWASVQTEGLEND